MNEPIKIADNGEVQQDAAVRAEEVAAYQSQLDAPLGQQPQSGCPASSDMFRSPVESLGDTKAK